MYSPIRTPSERSDRGSNTGLANGWTNDGGGCAVVRVVAGYDSQVRNSWHTSLETFAYFLISGIFVRNILIPKELSSLYDVFRFISRELLIVLINFQFESQLKLLSLIFEVEFTFCINNFIFTVIKFDVICISMYLIKEALTIFLNIWLYFFIFNF